MLKETAKVPVMAVLNRLADGSIENADPAVYDAIPDYVEKTPIKLT
ncbi:hypothetical protein [Bacillus sp. AFS073361]|nr:hypothetical protein [Bacillus sp. AFS073361]